MRIRESAEPNHTKSYRARRKAAAWTLALTSSLLPAATGCGLVGIHTGSKQPEHVRIQDVDSLNDQTVLARPATPIESLLAKKLRESVTPKPVRVDCNPALPRKPTPDSPETYMAYVNPPLGFAPVGVIHIAESLCQDMEQYAAMASVSGAAADPRAALYYLVHEAVHIDTTSTDEAMVSCIALQKVARFARSMGASKQWQEVAFQNALTMGYGRHDSVQQVSCYDGGPYDIDPARPGRYFAEAR